MISIIMIMIAVRFCCPVRARSGPRQFAEFRPQQFFLKRHLVLKLTLFRIYPYIIYLRRLCPIEATWHTVTNGKNRIKAQLCREAMPQ